VLSRRRSDAHPPGPAGRENHSKSKKKNAPRLAAIMARLNRFADPQHIGLGWGIQLISQHGLLSFSAGAFVFWSPL